MAREPRFGRFDEFYSEDPYLAGVMGVAAIRGLQGRNRVIDSEHLLACAKHFTGHGQPEGGSNMAPADYSERVIREMHCYPFEMAVKQANVRTVMASYNEIDGVPSHINRWLLTDILRGEWGFDGYVISDYDGVSRMINRQPLSINELATNASAILEGWYLGQEQGAAVARVLFGEVNPGGKLTVTIPRVVEPGDFQVMLGTSSAENLKSTFHVAGQAP